MSLCINPRCSKPENPDDNLFCQACGSELLLAGQYRVSRLLSDKGGFAKTYEVIDRNTQKVLKVLTQNNAKAVELFQQEAQVLSQLNHPGIPKGEGSFTYFPRDSQAPLHCLVMEKIEGMDLEEYQKQRNYRPIEQKLALEWLRQLAEILHEVHRHHCFHRDIKPSNIILKPNGQLALIDFGAVRQVTATILAGGQNTGIYTPGYAPPEQEKGYAIQQSDFFALGRTFIYLITGKEPIDPALYDHYKNELHWRSYAPNIDPQIANFIDWLMADKANQRPANTSEILQALAEIKGNLYPYHGSSVTEKTQALVSYKKPYPSPYAGFWLRFRASIIDGFIVTISGALMGGFLSFYIANIGLLNKWKMIDSLTSIELGKNDLMGTVFLGSIYTAFGTTWLGFFALILCFSSWIFNRDFFSPTELFFLVAIILGIGFKWFYFVFLESSWLKATFGKMIMGIIVTDFKGKPISLGRANKRYWGKLYSVITLYIGFMLAGWTKKKRALHDIIAGTLVMRG